MIMFHYYLKTALRSLRRRISYTLINVAGLAIGMAGCLLLLLHVKEEIGFDRYHPHADRIYRVVFGTSGQVASAMGPALQREFPEVIDSVRLLPPAGQWMMRAGDKVNYERSVYWADESLFDVFSYRFVSGGGHSALSAPYTVVITESVAEKYFEEANPVGRIIRADDLFDLTVTGVIQDAPANTHIRGDFFISMITRTELYYGNPLTRWTDRRYFTYLLLTEDAAASELAQKLPGFLDKHVQPSLRPESSPFLQPLVEIHTSSNLDTELSPNTDSATLFILTSVACFLILVACFNYIILATALSANRLHEFRARFLVGAHQRHLVRQYLCESTIVTSCAFMLAIGLVYLILPTFNSWLEKSYAISSIGWSWGWIAAICAMVLLAVLSGAYPALLFLKKKALVIYGGHSGFDGGRHTVGKGLVTLQFMVTVTILAASATVYQQLSYLKSKPLGFTEDPVVVITATFEKILKDYEVFKNELLQSPVISGVAVSFTIPGNVGGRGFLPTFKVRSGNSPVARHFEIPMLFADMDILETLGLEVLTGQLFAAKPGNGIIVNEAAARRLGWERPEMAIDQPINMDTPWNNGDFQVTGVVRDFHMRSLHHPIEPLLMARGPGGYISIRLHPEHMVSALRDVEHAWGTLYPGFPLLYSFLDDIFDEQYKSEETVGSMLMVFSLILLLIACLGLVGLVAFTTKNRAHEIGIRKVLGGTLAHTVSLLAREYLVMVLTAILAATPIAYLIMTYWLQNFAYRTDLDIKPFVFAGLITILIVMSTVSYHTLKAATANPVDSIRSPNG